MTTQIFFTKTIEEISIQIMTKLLFIIIPLIINIIILFAEQFQKITFLILFNLIIFFIIINNKNIFKNKTKKDFKKVSEDNLNNNQESAEDHPIIVSARKRLNK